MRSLIKLMLLALIVLCNQARAQDFFPEHTDYAFQLSADYDIPGKNLKETYKPGVGYSLSFLKYHEEFTFNVTAGYRTYGAKEPLIADTDPSSGIIGQWSTSPYSTFSLYLGAAYYINLAERVRAYGGLNLGMYFTNASIAYRDEFTNTFISLNGKQGYVAPKIGLVFNLSNYIDLDLRAGYNVFTAGTQSNSRTGTEGSLYTSITGGIGLAFKF